MMKDHLATRGYPRRFITHVKKFMVQGDLVTSRAVVAVSAGKDSMTLLTALACLRQEGFLTDLLACHVNHHTRSQNDQEQKLVEDYCQQLNIPCEVAHFQKSSGNFENEARQFRYQFFKSQLKSPEDKIYTAHHVDDSFEWSLMQQWKSSNLRSSLGIPVKQGVVARPFLCVSRQQIERLIREWKIPFLEDSSNTDLSFERNFIRHQIVPMIAKKYPSYLKHYVFRMNALAQKLNCYGLKTQNNFLPISFPGGVGLLNANFVNDFSGAELEVLSMLEKMLREVGENRASLTRQVEKLLVAVKTGSKGPLHFAQDIKAYPMTAMILVVNSKGEDWLRLQDEKRYEEMKQGKLAITQMSFPQFQKQLLSTIEQGNFPLWVSSPMLNTEQRKYIPSLKSTHSLSPLITHHCLEKNWWFQTSTGLLKSWKKEAHRIPSLPLVLSF